MVNERILERKTEKDDGKHTASIFIGCTSTYSNFAVCARILLFLQGLPSLVKFRHQRVVKVHNLKS